MQAAPVSWQYCCHPFSLNDQRQKILNWEGCTVTLEKMIGVRNLIAVKNEGGFA